MNTTDIEHRPLTDDELALALGERGVNRPVRPLPPMPFEPPWYLAPQPDEEPEPDPEPSWWDRTSARLAAWLTPGRAWAIYLATIVAALLGAWVAAAAWA